MAEGSFPKRRSVCDFTPVFKWKAHAPSHRLWSIGMRKSYISSIHQIHAPSKSLSVFMIAKSSENGFLPPPSTPTFHPLSVREASTLPPTPSGVGGRVEDPPIERARHLRSRARKYFLGRDAHDFGRRWIDDRRRADLAVKVATGATTLRSPWTADPVFRLRGSGRGAFRASSPRLDSGAGHLRRRGGPARPERGRSGGARAGRLPRRGCGSP